jgi:hypothetical protein
MTPHSRPGLLARSVRAGETVRCSAHYTIQPLADT